MPFWYEEVAEAKRSYSNLDDLLKPFLNNAGAGSMMSALKALNELILKEASEVKDTQLYPYQERRINAFARIFGDVALYEAVSEREKSSIAGKSMIKLYELEVETLKTEKALSGLAFGSAFKDDAAKNTILLENVRRQVIEPLLRRDRSATLRKRKDLAKAEPKTQMNPANTAPLPEDEKMHEEEPQEYKKGSVIRSRLDDWNTD